MSYELAIHPDAEREWGKLDEIVKKRFRQKLEKERLVNPRAIGDLRKQDCQYVHGRSVSTCTTLVL